MRKKNKILLLSILIIGVLILLFLISQKTLNMIHGDGSDSFDSEKHGPYIGYIKSSAAENIDIYTEIDGQYIASVPKNLISNFLAQNPGVTGEEIWLDADFYCGNSGKMFWAYAVSRPAFFSCISNLYTLSEKQNICYDIIEGGAVTGAVFVSEKVGFIGLKKPTELGFEIRATFDSGISWKTIEAEPPEIWTESCTLIPITDGADEGGMTYPFIVRDGEDETVIHLSTNDGGKTWYWEY